MTKNTEMSSGVARLHELRTNLEGQAARQVHPKASNYLGRGGMVEKSSYSTYVRPSAAGLYVSFLGRHATLPEHHVGLGSISIDLGREAIIQARPNMYPHDRQGGRPDISELAQPFGPWVVNGVVRSVKQSCDLRQQLREKEAEIDREEDAGVYTAEEADTLYELEARRQVEQENVSNASRPSIADVEPIVDFVMQATTVAHSRYNILFPGVGGLLVTHALTTARKHKMR